MRLRRSLSGSAVVVAGLATVLAGTTGVADAAAKAPKGLTSSVATKGSVVVGRATTLVPAAHLVAHDKVVGYTLSFGDGSKKATGHSLPKSVSHVFRKAGAFSVVLTVKDKLGHQAKTTHVVHVIAPASGSAVVVTVPAAAQATSAPVVGAPTIVGPTGPAYAAAVPIPTAPHPTSVVVSDLNRDGYPDAVVISTLGSTPTSYHQTLEVELNDGHGGYVPAEGSTALGITASTLHVAVADMNGDHVPDLVVSEYNAFAPPNSGTVAVYLGDGHGGFTTSQALTISGVTRSVVGGPDQQPDGAAVLTDGAGNYFFLKISKGALVSSALPAAKGITNPVITNGSLLGYTVTAAHNVLVRLDLGLDGTLFNPARDITLPGAPDGPALALPFPLGGYDAYGVAVPVTTPAGPSVDLIGGDGTLWAHAAVATSQPFQVMVGTGAGDDVFITSTGQQFALTAGYGLAPLTSPAGQVLAVTDANLDHLSDVLTVSQLRAPQFPGDDESVLGIAHQEGGLS